MEYKLKNMELSDLDVVFSKMKEDFPAKERAPFNSIRVNLKRKIFEGFLLTEGNMDTAYCINTSSTDGNYQLINYLATSKERRGQGIGTILLEELKKKYANKKAIIVEVEPPTDNEKKARVRFYEKAGFIILNDIEYTLFGVDMCVMFWSECLTEEEISSTITTVIQDIYHRTVPKLLWGRIKIRRRNCSHYNI